MVLLWQRKTAFWCVKVRCLFYKLLTNIMCRNRDERKAEFKRLRYTAEQKYLRRYAYAIKAVNTQKNQSPAPKIIWTCWWQGTKNLPPVVEKCIASIRKYCPDYELRIVTADNMHDYVTLPDYIMQKHKKGNISNAHFADMLRLTLLAQYGGIWMDATVFLTAPLPAEITVAPFFAFHCRELYQFQIWLIKACADNLLVRNLQQLLFEYWKYEDTAINYFFGYSLFDLMVKENPECAKMWAQTPLIYDDCYELADNFFAPYSAQKWAEIRAKTTIHKLSWKYKKEPAANSFLECLLSGKLGD